MNEDKLQSDCFIWAWNNRPQTRGLLCYNLNNSRNKIAGAKNKAMGLIKGRSDMVLYWSGSATMIEFKVPGQKQTPEQLIWQSIVQSNGFKYFVCDSLQQFQSIIDEAIT